ncbi:hypothetical protein BpHYR1_015514 [Brachionus plicatilis]|uniref:Uncharacterized protein n=1 Tax=Brachionus plicatilis TaxID=10195 RepID=A0A3M7PJU3_BRAPC|nr:hypothetical protein BpHYR1_015514 [Brachionus plicatilis]
MTEYIKYHSTFILFCKIAKFKLLPTSYRNFITWRRFFVFEETILIKLTPLEKNDLMDIRIR